jgi:class 3 adenylate cyclase/tetratricopeptide (TPR) repeat protein
VVTCPNCGKENLPEARFCMSCGMPLIGKTLTEERRLVTVLFCDLVGFTDRSDRADPEDVRAALRPYHARVRREIEHFGGEVEKFIGDAVVGVFGVPVAHGDDAERSVRAALRVIEAIDELNRTSPGLELAVRQAVNTGEAVVSVGLSPASGEGTVAGDVINTASRLQGVAPVGGVLVGELTYRATRHAFDYEELEPVVVKGKAEPISVWRPMRAKAEFPGEHEAEHVTPLVGRTTELSLLESLWKRGIADRRPHLVTLIGPSGIGKSRLLREFTKQIEPSGRAFLGRCRPYGETTGYGAFGQLVQQMAGVFYTDTASVAREKLARRVATLLPGASDVVAHLEVLLGLSAQGEPDKQLLLYSARRFVEAVAGEEPTVLSFEDIQWAESSLLDLIESLAARVRDVPLLVITLARPDLLDVRPSWGGGLTSYMVIPVHPLSDDEARSLARHLLAERPEATESINRFVQVSGGNPLFLEELGASMAERAAGAAAALPTTVREIIAARLDALPSEERRLLQDASVIGRFFWRGALLAISPESVGVDQRLDFLEVRDFIRHQPTSRIPSDQEFVFKHVVNREVAYSTLPRAVRQERHAAVALYLEGALGDRLRESASLLAHHWREAGEVARAADYLIIAADTASRAWAKQQAVALYTEAIELLEGTGERDRLDESVVARAMTRLDAGATAADLREDLEALPRIDGRHRAKALVTAVSVAMSLTDAAASRTLGAEAVTAVREASDLQLEARVLGTLSEIKAMDGDVEGAIDLAQESRSKWPHDAGLLSQSALYHYWRGDHRRALKLSEQSFELGMQTSDLGAVLQGAGHGGMALTGLSRHEEALDWFQRGTTLGRERELVPRGTSRIVNMWAGTLRELGDLRAARELNEQAREMAREAEFTGAQLAAEVDLLFADLLEGELGNAERNLPELLEAAARTHGWHQWLWAGRLAVARSEIHLGRDEWEKAAGAAEEAVKLSLGPGRLKYACRSRTVFGRAMTEMGRTDEAIEPLRQAVADAEQVGHQPSQWASHAALAEALGRMGRLDEADVEREQAATIVRGFLESLTEEHLSHVLSMPDVSSVLAS